jgi:hypothetical protein
MRLLLLIVPRHVPSLFGPHHQHYFCSIVEVERDKPLATTVGVSLGD